MPDLSTIEDAPIDSSLLSGLYPEDAPPVFFGHYQLLGTPEVQGQALCLNHPEVPLAYRWDGERQIRQDKLLMIGHEELALSMGF